VAGASRRSGASAPSMTGNELAVVARLARCGLRPVEQVEGCVSHRLGDRRCRFDFETPESSVRSHGGGQRQPHRCLRPPRRTVEDSCHSAVGSRHEAVPVEPRGARLDSGTGRDGTIHPPIRVSTPSTRRQPCTCRAGQTPRDRHIRLPRVHRPGAGVHREASRRGRPRARKPSRLGRIGSLGSKLRTPLPQPVGHRRHRHWGAGVFPKRP
jgi:hypothetical protein